MSRSKLLGFVAMLVLGAVASLAQSTSPVQYFYDDLGRLSQVVDQNGNRAVYHYDAVGNLLSITRTTVPANNGLAILNFNPQQGTVGATVTIQGQGFSATPSADAVQFNGTPATVTSATATALTVAVPLGATTGPISVTVAGTTVSSATNFTVVPATLVSIAVSPFATALGVGGTQQFTATGTYTDGSTQNLTSSVTWSSSNAGTAAISNSAGSQGLATGISDGATTIKATSGSTNGFATLRVRTMTGIAIAPSSTSVVNGATQQFTAQALYDDGSDSDATANVIWSSSATTVATISNAPGSQGLAATLANGTTSITAGLAGFSSSAALSVISLVSIAVTPANPSLIKGQIQQFAATGTYTDASTKDLTDTVTWTSSNTTVALIGNVVGSHGFARTLTTGTTTITATLGAISGSTTLTVSGAVPVSLFVSPANVAVSPGGTVQFNATVTLSDGTSQALTTTAVWATSDPTIATISNSTGSQATATGVSPGVVTVTVASGGLVGTANLVVNSPLQPRFAYVAGASEDTVATYIVNPVTGQLRLTGYVAEAAGSAPFASTLDPTGKFLFVANSGTGDFAVYTVNATNGVLTPVAGSPFSSGFNSSWAVVNPAADFVYVINNGDNTISAFAYDPVSGVLTAVPGSPFSTGNGPIGAAIDSAGKFLFVTNTADNTLSVFALDPISGVLTPVTGSPYPVGTHPQNIAVDPAGNFVYVANTFGGSVSAFSYDPASGALTEVSGSPFGTFNDPGGITTDPAGKFLFAGGIKGNNISIFSIDPASGALTATPNSPFPVSDPSGLQYLVLDPTGLFLYETAGSSTVYAYGVDPTNGNLTYLSTSALPGSEPEGSTAYPIMAVSTGTAAVTYTPQFAYLASSGTKTSGGTQGANSVSAYTIGSTTGVLAPVNGSPFADGLSPELTATDFLGRFLFVTNDCSDAACFNPAGSISAYTIDPIAGALTAVSGSPYLAGQKPTGVAVDPSGRFVYVANRQDGTISGYMISAPSGALTPISGLPIVTTANPVSLSIDPVGVSLYVVSGCPNNSCSSGTISVYSINPQAGTLALSTSYSAGVNPSAIAITSPWDNVYIADYASNDILALTYDPATLSLNSQAFATGQGPSAIAVDPTGTFLYVANSLSNNLSAFRIDPIVGTLTYLPSSPIPVGSDPVSMTIDISGTYLYVVNQGDNTVSAFSIDPASGALTQLAGSPFAGGAIPTSITTTGTTQ